MSQTGRQHAVRACCVRRAVRATHDARDSTPRTPVSHTSARVRTHRGMKPCVRGPPMHANAFEHPEAPARHARTLRCEEAFAPFLMYISVGSRMRLREVVSAQVRTAPGRRGAPSFCASTSAQCVLCVCACEWSSTLMP
eukprot:9689898-Alexandrium_andersonii.AAC.1